MKTRNIILSAAFVIPVICSFMLVTSLVYAGYDYTNVRPGKLYTDRFTSSNGDHIYKFESAGDQYTITVYCRHAFDPYDETGKLLEGVPADGGCVLPIDAWYEKTGKTSMDATGMEGFSLGWPELTADGWYKATGRMGVFQKGDIIEVGLSNYYDAKQPGYIGQYKFVINGKVLPDKDTPAKTKITGLKAGNKSFTIICKKVSNASGYQVQYSLKKSFANAKKKTLKKAGTTSVKIRKLKSKKRYYVRVRSYKTVGDKRYYSAWSTKKSIKTK